MSFEADALRERGLVDLLREVLFDVDPLRAVLLEADPFLELLLEALLLRLGLLDELELRVFVWAMCEPSLTARDPR